MKMLPATAVAAFLSLSALALAPAAAEGKAWSSLKNRLPADLYVVAGGNVTTLRGSLAYQQLAPMLLGQDEVKAGLAEVKTACGIDVETAIVDVVIAIQKDEKGIIAAAVAPGIDEAKVTSCVKKLAATKQKKLTAKKVGKLVEYTIAGEKEKLYVAWLAKDVVAIATQPDDRAFTQRWLGGKGAGGDIAAALGKVNTGAVVWGAMSDREQQGPGFTAKAIYAAVDLAAGNVRSNVNVLTGSAAEAKEVTQGVTAAMALLPPELRKIAKGLKLTTVGAEAAMSLTMTEAELQQLISLAIAQL